MISPFLWKCYIEGYFIQWMRIVAAMSSFLETGLTHVEISVAANRAMIDNCNDSCLTEVAV
jgi:hypothetical protein